MEVRSGLVCWLDNKQGCLKIRQRRHEKGQKESKPGQVQWVVEKSHEEKGFVPGAEKAGGPGEAQSPWLLCSDNGTQSHATEAEEPINY
jgi:hypothetical protein